MLNLGKYDGLEVGNVVVYGDALIGRISEIGDNFSTALLISDSSIKIPIEFIKSQRKFIVNGYDNLNDSLHLTLPFSSFGQDEKNIMLLPGDIAITSAENDLIPAGLIVGHVVQGDSHDAADVNTIKANNNSDNAANGECITSLTTNLSAPDNVKLKVQFNVNMLSLVSVLVKKTA
jgi:cell shape-determining protein MreC